jgi:hypothetical protein
VSQMQKVSEPLFFEKNQRTPDFFQKKRLVKGGFDPKHDRQCRFNMFSEREFKINASPAPPLPPKARDVVVVLPPASVPPRTTDTSSVVVPAPDEAKGACRSRRRCVLEYIGIFAPLYRHPKDRFCRSITLMSECSVRQVLDRPQLVAIARGHSASNGPWGPFTTTRPGALPCCTCVVLCMTRPIHDLLQDVRVQSSNNQTNDTNPTNATASAATASNAPLKIPEVPTEKMSPRSKLAKAVAPHRTKLTKIFKFYAAVSTLFFFLVYLV